MVPDFYLKKDLNLSHGEILKILKRKPENSLGLLKRGVRIPGDIISYMIDNDPENLSYFINCDGCTFDLIEKGLQTQPYLLVNIIESPKITDEMIVYCCSSTPAIIPYVNKDKKFKSWMYAEILDRNQYALSSIPIESIDRKMCESVIKKGGDCIHDIPPKFQDKEMWELALLSKDPPNFKNIPKDFLDEKMWQAGVISNFTNFEDIPIEFITKEMCMDAIKENGTNLFNIGKRVPDIVDRKMCIEAVKNDWYAINYVPDKFKDYNMWLTTVGNHPQSIQYLPPDSKFRDKRMYMAIVTQKGKNLYLVPKKYREEDICLEAVKTYYGNITDVPDDVMNKEILQTAIDNGAGEWEIPARYRHMLKK